MIPLSFSAVSFLGGNEADTDTGAFFLQHGLTRYSDDHGLLRNDLRYGAVHRFDLTDEPEANVLGVSAFLQQNLEYGHRALVTGLDYTGAWGRGTFNYFRPATDWRNSPVRFDQEERALEGMELGLHLQPTSTLLMETALTRWEYYDDKFGERRQWATGARVGLSWRPHPYLDLGATRDGIGTGKATQSISATINIPLGDGRKFPRWQGLGRFGFVKGNKPAELWRPIEQVGRIRVAERTITPHLGQGVPQDLTVQFLQARAGSGEQIGLQVTLPSAAREDLRLHLRLVPGKGDNPALAGEDYVDEPVEVIIRRGTTGSKATVRLLHNPGLTEARTLSVEVSLAT